MLSEFCLVRREIKCLGFVLPPIWPAPTSRSKKLGLSGNMASDVWISRPGSMSFASIEDAAADIRDGRMIIIVDDEDRENEGDLVCAAEKTTPEVINFMARYARGLICLPLTEERCDELHLTTQVADNTSFLGTAFTVSIDGRKGVSTGISASDRATTILTAVDPKTKPSDLARPGHIFPLRAKTGAYSFDLVKPKRVWTLRVLPDFILLASSARS